MSEENNEPPTPVTPVSPDTLTGVTALARFEFEAGRGNEGTKVMMVEWQTDQPAHSHGSWHVSWAGKRTVFPADDRPASNIRRSYFLIPPGAAIPPHIKLAYQPSSDEPNSTSEPQSKTVKPLPAIFTPELGATAKASGKKGVLHTIWAKKRLQSLEKEIQQEQEHNLEGIALEMATAERDWIQDNFGLQVKPSSLDINTAKNADQLSTPVSPSLIPPRSPNTRRLSEKLKGLSLGTSEKDLTAKVNTPTSELHPLSPEVSDMAYSSFSTFRTGPASPKSASTAAQKRVVAQAPPASILRQQTVNESSPSLNFVSNLPPGPNNATTSDDPDDLFAVALSPRSPEIAKSPFSFTSAEVTQRRAKQES